MPERFKQLDFIDDQVIGDFSALLSELSSSFAQKDEGAKAAAVEQNLTAALEAPNTFVMVYRDSETRRIVSTATGNIVLGSEGWVDDVVTLTSHRGQHLGHDSMQALHNRFNEASIQVIRLTSSFDRETAGNLYARMGYIEGGTVWRNPETYNFLNSGSFEGSDGCFKGVNCLIPTGNKAWLYGPYRRDQLSRESYPLSIRLAAGELMLQGVTSVNYFDAAPLAGVDPLLVESLGMTGFKQRGTRLYTLDLELSSEHSLAST